MQILLANAKIMFDKAERKPISVPLFQSVANVLAEEMARMNVEELARQLAKMAFSAPLSHFFLLHVEFHVRSRESALNRFISHQSKKF